MTRRIEVKTKSQCLREREEQWNKQADRLEAAGDPFRARMARKQADEARQMAEREERREAARAEADVAQRRDAILKAIDEDADIYYGGCGHEDQPCCGCTS